MPSHLTQEQLDFFTEQTKRAVRKALKKYAIASTAGFVILVGGVGAALTATNHDAGVARDAIIKSGTVIAVDGCNGRYDDRVALRDLFVRLQGAVKVQAKQQHLRLDSQEVQFALKFYKDELGRLPLPDCRPTAHILTDSPYPPVHIPAPKHPRKKG